MKLFEVQKIWDLAPHNAFTDLVRFNQSWFCVFREGEGHVSEDGALRVITSQDSYKWESAALITSKKSDLRDAKISVTPWGQLMLCGVEALHKANPHTHQSLCWFSENGTDWKEKREIGDPNNWLWRITWNGDVAYGMGYGCNERNRGLRLYQSADGRSFSTLGNYFVDDGYPNETSIVFRGETAYCLLRRDGDGETAMIGTSRRPFHDWTWKDLGVWLGGPHMLILPEGRLLATVRTSLGGVDDDERQTVVGWINPDEGIFEECLVLPSGGDTSYAGMVLNDGLLNVSYYSSHEGKTAIYFAKIADFDK